MGGVNFLAVLIKPDDMGVFCDFAYDELPFAFNIHE
jgi:hypothetical protein